MLRDRFFLALAFAMPVLLVFAFGYGIIQDVRGVPLVVVDYDQSAQSRGYIDHFARSEHFDFRGQFSSEAAAHRLLQTASARVVVVVPRGFHEHLASGGRGEIQVLLDGSFTTTHMPRAIAGYVAALNEAASLELASTALARRIGTTPARARTLLRPIEVEVRYLYNPELRGMWSVAPGLLMFVMIFVTPMLMCLSVVREKETGSIFNIYGSPVTRLEFLVGKMIPNVALAALDAAIIWSIVLLHFGAPFRGSIGTFLVATLLYLVAAAGIGLIVSVLVRTQQTAVIVIGVTMTVLGMSYSGMMVPVASQAPVQKTISHAFPPMYYLNVIESTFLRGEGWSQNLRELGVLAAFACVYLWVAHAFFHKRTST